MSNAPQTQNPSTLNNPAAAGKIDPSTPKVAPIAGAKDATKTDASPTADKKSNLS